MYKNIGLLLLAIAVVVLGTGCQNNDYGESAVCIEKSIWDALGQPTFYESITAINSGGFWCYQIFPGQIGTLTVQGGYDEDLTTTQTEPNGICPDGCPSTPDAKICIAIISNRNVPYTSSGSTGYISEFYQDKDEPTGTGRTFYFAGTSDAIASDQPFSITVAILGASQGEFEGAPNWAIQQFNGTIKPSPVCTLRPVRNPQAAMQDVDGMLHRASIRLREDKAHQSSTTPPMDLKQRYQESRDHSANAEYKAAVVETSLLAPKDLASVADIPLVLCLCGLGYDVLE
jgi:hypothetical protein